MRFSTSGAHCLGVGCDHDSARDAAAAHPTPVPRRGRRARGGRHERTPAGQTRGRRAA